MKEDYEKTKALANSRGFYYENFEDFIERIKLISINSATIETDEDGYENVMVNDKTLYTCDDYDLALEFAVKYNNKLKISLKN